MAALREMKQSALAGIKGVALAKANPPLGAPGAAAADRLGVVAVKRGRAAALQQQQSIPGMEPAEQPKPRNKPQEVRQHFSLHDEEASAFPVLGGNADNTAVNIKPGRGPPATNYAAASSRAINAMDPNHAGGFVSNYDQYMALVNSQNGGTSVDDGDFGGGSEGASQPPAMDPADIDDELLMFAVKHGLEAAGLGPEYAAYVDSVRGLMGEELAATERAECEAAERVVAEAERAEAEAVAAKVSLAGEGCIPAEEPRKGAGERRIPAGESRMGGMYDTSPVVSV